MFDTWTRRIGGASVAALAVVTLGTVAANAATLHGSAPVTATTKIINRPDSGGAGNWAYDTMTRTATWTYLGKAGPAATPYQYQVTLRDAGTFKDIPGAYTPNQGGRYAGTILKPAQVSGTITGTATAGVFDASAKVNSPRTFANLGVPIRLSGATQNGRYPTGTWAEDAFPAGTVFAGVSLLDWGWDYAVPAVTVTVHGVRHTVKAQDWSDTAGNGGGQLRGDGQITGRS